MDFTRIEWMKITQHSTSRSQVLCLNLRTNKQTNRYFVCMFFFCYDEAISLTLLSTIHLSPGYCKLYLAVASIKTVDLWHFARFYLLSIPFKRRNFWILWIYTDGEQRTFNVFRLVNVTATGNTRAHTNTHKGDRCLE